MKLKNKKTGEIIDVKDALTDSDNFPNHYTISGEWEDYEEPKDKDFWFFDEEGIIRDTKEENWPEESVAAAKEIGNYFETKEEAEKAVEKLKAWKRLKDKGFKIDLWGVKDYGHIEENDKDLDLLFGGEE